MRTSEFWENLARTLLSDNLLYSSDTPESSISTIVSALEIGLSFAA
jgi:hypothetical protein